jgi:hypothetical protein
MGGEGFISAMITSLKKNNSALRKGSIFKDSRSKNSNSNRRKGEISEASRLKLIEEGNKIRDVQRQQQKVYLWAAAIILLTLIALLIKLIFLN